MESAPKPTLWHANITSFRGISIGAMHWYVRLHCPRREVTVEWTLDEHRAAEMTEREHGSFTWRVGNRTNRFDTKDQARTAARLAYSWVDPGDGLLLEGQAASSSPQLPLAGNPEFMAKAQAWFDAAEKVEWYEGDHRAMSKIGDEWFQWELATFDPGPSTWRSGDTSREEFVITGSLDNPTGVWCSTSGEPEPDEDEDLPEDEKPHGGLVSPGIRALVQPTAE